MALHHPMQRASQMQTATVFLLVSSWTQLPAPQPKPPARPQTPLEQDINAWVKEVGRGDDEGP